MKKRAALAAGLKPLVDLVYPPRCPLCGEAVVRQGGLCGDCYGELEIPGEPACTLCQRPLGTDGAGAGNETCFACRENPPSHCGIHAATIYNDASRRLLLNFKHGGRIALAGLMARLIGARLTTSGGDDPPLLIPVPLHRWRIWKRGYNQAALLARELARQGQGELLVDGLVRRKPTRSLGGMGREERERMLAGAIRPAPSRLARMEGRRIVLVDDVLTSGATSNACVAALIEAGAKEVQIACFARVVGAGGGIDANRLRSARENPEHGVVVGKHGGSGEAGAVASAKG